MNLIRPSFFLPAGKLCQWLFFLLVTVASCPAAEPAAVPAFAGAQGFGATTSGGRGGTIIRVTSLKANGAGSLDEALRTKGPRIVVFEVGGVIDLAGKNLQISEPFVSVAGQTAPAPGITLIRGGLVISTHDVVVQHLAVRTGEAGRAKKSGWEVDAISTVSASNVVVDHCSSTWATDENLSASGPRFEGNSLADWQRNTSHHVTFSHCIIAEGLSNSTHGKGEHSKGSLIHDNASFISIIRNLYACNMERNPLFKGGAQAVAVNNWISNPGRRAMHYGLVAAEWGSHPHATGRLAIVGNVLELGPDSRKDMAFFTLHTRDPLELFLEDNEARTADGTPIPLAAGSYMPAAARPLWPEPLTVLPAREVKAAILKQVGARPWDRDPIGQRIIQAALEGKGRIINSESEAGGYPHRPGTTAGFRAEDWNLDTLTRKPK
jgi:pectate lyase